MTFTRDTLCDHRSRVVLRAVEWLHARRNYKARLTVHAHSANFRLLVLSLLAMVSTVGSVFGQNLRVTYGAKGIQTLSYAGTVLADVNAYPADAFHIYHMKCETAAGVAVTSGQYGWGENNNSTTWNPATQTETYTFSWGSIAVRFAQSGDTLNLLVTETNNANSNVKFDGAEIVPLTFHFPQDPSGFQGYSQFLNTTTGPGVSTANYGSGAVTAVFPDESVPMHAGWKNTGTNSYSPLMTTTSPDGLAAFLPHTDYPLAPGGTFQYTLSLRFTAGGVTADATDAYRSFAATYPSQVTWSDHRILGTAYLASSPANVSGKTRAGGFPTNPRRYFNDSSVDVTTSAGLQQFQNRILAQAASNVTNTQNMNGQGVITWDVEGEQYPQDTSYVCAPDQIAAVAPEMETAVLNRQSPYFGAKLDDAYFKTMTDAGLRVGVCIRPQQFTIASDGSASQSFLTTNDAIVANLERKVTFASTRWGASIFYVDSTVDSNGGTLDPAIFQRLITDFPSFLFIPEETTPRYYAYSAPFYSFLFHGTIGTDPSVYQYYPKAFGANLVNDVSSSTLQSAIASLTQVVAKGDILMGLAGYWQANDPILVAIYQAAGVVTLPPIQVTPKLTWATPAAIPYGTPLSQTQLNASASTVGTFTYNPAQGTVLPGGVATLLTTFTPSDARDYTTATASTTLTISPATSPVSWVQPDPIVYGTPLGSTQLNATSSVAGNFTYSPAAGTVLAAGTALINASFTPQNTGNYQTAQAVTRLTVTRATPAITWNTPTAISQGTKLSSAQLNATANVAGTFTYTPPPGTVLPAGSAVLNVTFIPTDSGDYSTATATVPLSVQSSTPGTPVATWPTPSAITYGTPLSAQQLNASFSAAGTVSYTPGPGTVLPAGTTTLQAFFTPQNAAAYQPTSARVQLVVAKAQPAISWAAPASVVAGSSLTSVQLNASASIPGTMQYTPAAGTVLSVGTQMLTAQFTPVDSADYTTTSASVPLQVTSPAPTYSGDLYVTSPATSTTVSGVVTVAAVCRLTLDSAGTYLMVDGVEVGTRRVVDGPYIYPLDTTTLTNGPHVLQVWGHDIGNRVTLSPQVPIVVAN